MGRSAFFKPTQADVEAHIGRRGARIERAQHNGLNRADLPGASGSRVLHGDGAAKWSPKCQRRRRFFNQALAQLIFINETSDTIARCRHSRRCRLSQDRATRTAGQGERRLGFALSARPQPVYGWPSRKLKALLRKWAARSFVVIAGALGEIFSVTECRNYFNTAGYRLD